ncbi:post-PEP-CTERM-1 domain-containing protein [Massilia suwonensis]|uniref:Post-PEP-CTERM-1 domain-containing protein n=1 Tax=Massilia suwonensis TaxID=648895 RepID=A0ABW0MU54_9BURK
MSQKHQSGQRLLCAAGITLALLGLGSQSAFAQEAAQDQEVQSIPLQSVDSMTVVRDPVTGKVRHATAEEQATLQAQSAKRMSLMRAAPKPTLQKFHPNGARGVRLTDEFVSSVRAERKADGSLSIYESHNADPSAAVPGHVHTNKVETE